MQACGSFGPVALCKFDAVMPARENERMAETPKRRWFRFRLSTVLVLTAIVAWGMATRPYVVSRTEVWTMLWRPDRTSPTGAVFVPKAGRLQHSHELVDGFRYYEYTCYAVERSELNLRFVLPALALFAFLAWKAARAVVERRRRRAGRATRLGPQSY